MLTISYMLINYCISVYIIGNMTILTTQADAETRKFRKQLADAEAFMDAYQLPPAMQRHMRGVLTLRFNDAQEHREVLDALPPALRRRVAANLYRPLIERAYIFRGLPRDDAFVGVFATSLVVELFMPFVSILTQGNPALELFFVASGSAVAVMSGDGVAGDPEPLSEGDADAMAAEEADAAAATRVGGRSGRSSVTAGERGPLAAARSAVAACLPGVGTKKRGAALERSGTDIENASWSHGGFSSVVHNLNEGDCFGEVAFVFALPQPWGVRTTSLSRMLFIRHDFWERVRGARPHDARELAGRIAEAVTRRSEQADEDATAAVASGSSRAPAAVRVARIYAGLMRKVRGKLAQREREAEALRADIARRTAGK
jgi:CRP-like cAMP-binding protein